MSDKKNSKEFSYNGFIPSSKSEVNRALILAEDFGNCSIIYKSSAADVILLEAALANKRVGKARFFLGAGGTTFRFFSIWISQFKGEWHLDVDKKLLERPLSDLKSLFDSLGVDYSFSSTSLKIVSKGWPCLLPKINFDLSKTSQYLSAFLLVAGNVYEKYDININQAPSSYLLLTLRFLEKVGWDWDFSNSILSLKLKKEISDRISINCDADWSSAAAVIALAGCFGSCCLSGLNFNSDQPDRKILDIFDHKIIDGILRIQKEDQSIEAFDFDFTSCPDLFPILAVVAILRKGTSNFMGLEKLQYKESDRLKETLNIYKKLGVVYFLDGANLSVEGGFMNFDKIEPFNYDPANDHRMVMAATILQWAGVSLRIKNSECVSKSFPEFLMWVNKECHEYD